MTQVVQGKVEAGHCHTHKNDTGKPCEDGKQFHRRSLKKWLQTYVIWQIFWIQFLKYNHILHLVPATAWFFDPRNLTGLLIDICISMILVGPNRMREYKEGFKACKNEVAEPSFLTSSSVGL